MKITRDNYEAYFLDYHEGNLTEGQKAQLMEFLAQNPSLKEEFVAFEMVEIEEDNISLPFGKNFLKKPVNDTNPDTISEETLIAYHEGDLAEKEKKQVLKAVAESPDIRKAFTHYSLTRLEVDASIVFPSKSLLKKHFIATHSLIIRRLAVAAALLTFMVSLYFLLPGTLDSQQFADEQKPAPEEEREEISLGASAEELPVLAEIQPDLQPEIPSPSATETSPREITRQPVRIDVSQLALMKPSERAELQVQDQRPQTIDLREDFYWFTYAGNIDMADYEEDELPQPQQREEQRYTSLASLAYSGIERSTGIDLKNMENQFTERNFGLWDIAGMGLAGISHITGTSLTIDKETDETGRITSLGIGERFKISR